MKTLLIIGFILLMRSIPSHCQEEKLEIEGAIQIGEASASPDPGTIRFNPTTNDFEGWNGFFWASLTGFSFETGTVQDVDLNTYKTVKIGDQWWMAENLKTSNYKNGNLITFIDNDVQGDADWGAANYGAWCVNDEVPNYEDIYGKLYNWFAVDDARGLCPTGWSVPDDADWMSLSTYLGGENTAGGKMKETGLIHWNSPNEAATNESGFSGFAGGFRSTNGQFIAFGNTGFWWSTSVSGSDGIYRSLFHNQSYISSSIFPKQIGFSVRCLKD